MYGAGNVRVEIFFRLPTRGAAAVLQRLLKMAPEVGLEPTTHRLTADCSTIELLWNPNGRAIYKPIQRPSNGFVQDTASYFVLEIFCLRAARRLPSIASLITGVRGRIKQ